VHDDQLPFERPLGARPAGDGLTEFRVWAPHAREVAVRVGGADHPLPDEGLGVNASNASRACDKLVTAGLLDRQTDEHDRRSIVLTLTRKGKRLVNALMKERQTMFEQIAVRMTPEDQQQLGHSLRAFVAAAAQISSDGGLLDEDGHSLVRLV